MDPSDWTEHEHASAGYMWKGELVFLISLKNREGTRILTWLNSLGSAGVANNAGT